MKSTFFPEIKSIVNIPAWAQERDSDSKVKTSAEAYTLVPLIHRCVNMRASMLSGIPIRTYRNKEKADWFWSDVPAREMIFRTEAALLLTGAAYWLKATNAAGMTTGIRWLNPYTVDTKWDEKSRELSFYQTIGSKKYGPWSREQMLYFRDFNPSDDVGRGVSSVEVAIRDAQLLYHMTTFASTYFESGAMPATILSITGGATPTADDTERIQSSFSKAISGVKNAFRLIALRGDVKLSTLTPPLEELTMKDLHEQARRSIALSMGIPVTLLEDASNFATAVTHRKSAYRETVIPRAMMFAETVNAQCLDAMNCSMVFDWESMEIFQREEAERSKALVDLVNAGLELPTAMAILGFDVPEGFQLAQEEPVSAPEITPEPITIGGNGNAPEMDVSDIQSMMFPSNNKMTADMMDDLKKWQGKAVKRIKIGKDPTVFFSEFLPPTLMAAISGALDEVEHPEDVRAVFSDASMWASRAHIAEHKAPVGEDTYTTKAEAVARAKQIGCSGMHTLTSDGETLYMPCESHEAWQEQTRQYL